MSTSRKDILISTPRINNDRMRSHTAQDQYLAGNLRIHLVGLGIRPSDYPRAVDLCSGEGYVAYMLTNYGWKPNDITCIDLYMPSSPFVTSANWRYMDLYNLGKAIKSGEKLPSAVEFYREKFDIGMMILGINKYQQELMNFFVRNGGISCNYPDTKKLLIRRKHWKALDNNNMFAEKL